MPMLPPDSIIGESPIVVEVVNCGIVLGVPLPPTCARPIETNNELNTSVARILRFMIRLRFVQIAGTTIRAAKLRATRQAAVKPGRDLREYSALPRAHGANALSRSGAPAVVGDQLASDGGPGMHSQL